MAFQHFILSLFLFGLVLPGITAQARKQSPQYSRSVPCRGEGSNPAVYHFSIGRTQAAVISDGIITITTDIFSEPAVAENALRQNFRLDGNNTSNFAVNTLYLKRPDGIQILIDTGNGNTAPPNGGEQIANLRSIGVRPEDIDYLLLSHSHFDHIGGVLKPDGSLMFPNAVHFVSRIEFNFYTAPNVDLSPLSVPPALPQAFIDLFREVPARVFSAIPRNKLRLFDFNGPVLPGIVPRLASHHTPGHAIFEIQDGMDRLIYTGDALGEESTQINVFTLRFLTEIDRNAGVTNRFKLLSQLTQSRSQALVYHEPFPGLGNVAKTEFSFEFKPIRYQSTAGVQTRCPAPRPGMRMSM